MTSKSKPLDGGPVERLTATAAQESYPVWSPDGRAIAFYDQAPPLAVQVIRRGEDGRWSSPVVTASPGSSGEWSPDGRWLSYIVPESVGRPGPVMVVPAAGGAAREVLRPTETEPPAADARWSPDSRTIYYKAHDARGRASFWAVSAAGGRPRLLARFNDPARQSSRKDFATDGKRLYFAIEDRQSDVFVAELIVK